MHDAVIHWNMLTTLKQVQKRFTSAFILFSFSVRRADGITLHTTRQVLTPTSAHNCRPITRAFMALGQSLDTTHDEQQDAKIDKNQPSQAVMRGFRQSIRYFQAAIWARRRTNVQRSCSCWSRALSPELRLRLWLNFAFIQKEHSSISTGYEWVPKMREIIGRRKKATATDVRWRVTALCKPTAAEEGISALPRKPHPY